MKITLVALVVKVNCFCYIKHLEGYVKKNRVKKTGISNK